MDRLVGEYKSISADLEGWSKDLDLNSPEKINQIEQKVSKLSSLLEEKATEKDMLASEGAKLESKSVKDAAQKITEKLQVLQKAALKTEQQCKDLQVLSKFIFFNPFPLEIFCCHGQSQPVRSERFRTGIKTSMWKEYVCGWMTLSTHVISLSPQA